MVEVLTTVALVLLRWRFSKHAKVRAGDSKLRAFHGKDDCVKLSQGRLLRARLAMY